MKRFIYFFSFCIFFFWGSENCIAQKKMNARVYNRFLYEYQSNSETDPKMNTVIRHDTSVHPLAIASNYFVNQKIYPNEDAVRLVAELNPKINMSADAESVAGDTYLVLPKYPPANKRVMQAFKAAYYNDSIPNQGENQAFKNASAIFNQIFQKLVVPGDEVGKKYYDSLAFFNNRILPHINNSPSSISRLQMHYFNTEINALNELFKPKRLPLEYRRGAANSHEQVSYIIADFYEIANPIQVRIKSLYSTRVREIGESANDGKFRDLVFFDPLNATPFACNLYIYEKDQAGNRKADPEKDNYDVWVGDKMSFDAAVKGSDPTTFGFTRMSDPASTLPFQIGLGKWIVVMKKQTPAGTPQSPYLHTEISIFSELKKEPNDPNVRKVTHVVD